MKRAFSVKFVSEI